MPLNERDLVSQFGRFVTTGNASIFVGAGLSQSAGYPGWPDLLARPRAEALIPNSLLDLPLVAQYYVQTMPGGRDRLEAHILAELARVDATPTLGHAHLAGLPVDEIWTTNYDCLLEIAIPDAAVITGESDIQARRTPGRRRIIKMHGSLTRSTPVEWRARPVITRQDYEQYARANPRMWALLRATYLTRSMLFLGFSFTDPNIDILLRLSRTMSASREHYTVLRRPVAADERRLHDLKRHDLEQSGVGVCEVEDFNELEPLLQRLARRTRSTWLFVAGSNTDGQEVVETGRAIGGRLADLDISVVSLAGEAAQKVSFAFGRALHAQGRYAAERIRLFFRSKEGSPPPPLPERLGTAVYTHLDQRALRAMVLRQCRAMVILGGGTNSAAEAELAEDLAIPIIPVARTGGAAGQIWGASDTEPSWLDLSASSIDDGRDWALLNHADIDICTAAVARLVRRAMYLETDSDDHDR